MAQVKLYRGSQETSLPITIEDGSIYVMQTDSTSGELYADLNGQRIKLGSGSGASFTKTKSEWDENRDLVSSYGTIYIYSDARSYTDENDEVVYVPGIKIGDGTSYVVDLPFVNVTAQQINTWNNKVTCYLASDLDNLADAETLVFSKD